MPLKPGDPGYNYETGTAPRNVVTVDSRPPPSGGGAGSTVGTPSQPQAPRLAPTPTYELGGSFYYHPSLGKGTMTGVWGDPRAGGARRHEGQDIRMPMNTPLVAVTSGTVTHYKNSSAGTVVYLRGDDGNKYSYFHLNSRVARNGQRVQAGQVIAYSGNTGNSSAPHLHFEVWNKGRKVDPRYFLSQTRSPGSAPDPRLAKEDKYFGGDQAQPGGVPEIDLFGENQFQLDLASIFSGVDYTDPNRPYGQWVDELRRIQGDLAQQGFAKSPRKLKAHEAVRRLISGMSTMVQRDGYTSKFGDQGGGGKVSSQGENVVTVPDEEAP